MFAPRHLTIALLLAVHTSTISAQTQLEPTGSWAGKIRDEALRAIAPKNGVIADGKTWTTVWKAWRADEDVPKLDFDETLVLVGVVSGPNLVLLNPSLEEGDVRFVVGGTKIGGPGFGYKFVAIPRAGVVSVNGTSLESREETTESIRVEVVGTLRTGIFAIGGETTGTTITAKGVTWELDLGENAKLRKLAESMDGKRVRVEGSLERRKGVEIGERWIVTVSALGTPETKSDGKKDKPKTSRKASAVSGGIVVPATVPAFADQRLEIKLFEFDPRLADVSATLIDEYEAADFGHEGEEKTKHAFGVGTDFEPRDNRSYYITVFVTKDGKRTHIGERDGKPGLCKVLTDGNPSEVTLVLRPVR